MKKKFSMIINTGTVKVFFCIAFILIQFVNVHAQKAEEQQRRLNVYWTDIPPVLDGKMDDACWKNTEVAKDFTQHNSKGKPANLQTEVRICYDAEYLYAFYFLKEKNMKKLNLGPPDDTRDKVYVLGDVAELFLDPLQTKKFYCQFMIGPAGARYDSCKGRGKHFNPIRPDWKCKTALLDNGWTVELAIPYRLLTISGLSCGTPEVGNIWGVNFCRDQGHLREWSYWKSTGFGFHRPERFGELLFKGRCDGTPLPQAKWQNSEPMYYGKGALEIVGKPEGKKLQLTYLLEHDSKKVEEKTIAMAPSAKLPYHLTKPGRWTMDATVTADGKPVFNGRSVVELRPVAKMLLEIKEKTNDAEKQLKDFNHSAKSAILKRLKQLTTAAAGTLAELKDIKQLTRAQWKKLEDQIPHLKKLWRDIRFDLHIIQFYPKGKDNVAFVIGVAGPHDRIHRGELYNGSLTAPIKLSAAGGERESFQLLVIPFWYDLKSVKIDFSDLKGPKGTISKDNFEWNIVDYVKIGNWDPDKPGTHEFEPDILWPSRPFDVKAGQLQPLFVNFYLPEDTPKGVYKGSVTISANNQKVTREIDVNAYGFNIPWVNSIYIDPWYAPSGPWGTYYGKGYGQAPFDLNIYEKHLKILKKYRHACYPLDYFAMWKLMTVYREPDGSYSFDFSKWRKVFELGLKYGATGLGASFGCNGGSYRPFMYGRVIDRATGKKMYIQSQDDVKAWREKMKKGEATWDEHPFYNQFMKELVKVMREEGVLHLHDFEMHDEPKSLPDWQRMIKHHQQLRRVVPELKFKNYGFGPETKMGDIDGYGWADSWAPNLKHMTPKTVKEIHERRAKWGEKFIWYTCGQGFDEDGNPTPFITYDQSYLAPRIHGWINWKFKADGFLIFAMTYGPNKVNKGKFPKESWNSGPWGKGCGVLVYPGPNNELIPCMRLASVRDGLEDYEYMKILHDRLRYLNPEKHAELIKKIEKELEVEPEIYQDLYHWAKDQKIINTKRDRVAALIRQVDEMMKINTP